MSKNRSKNFMILAKTLSRFFVRSREGEKRETGGNTFCRCSVFPKVCIMSS